jgi:peptide-methionine (S)-S-oxide reductase
VTCEDARMLDYHQQYLAKNPMGYCGIGGTGVSCPIGVLGK